MRDPRIDKLADLLVDYSVKVQPKQKVLIHGELGSEPLISACFKKCLQAGAYPFAVPYIADWVESTLRYGSPEQYAEVYRPFKEMYETYDARIRILGELNTKELSQFDPAKVSQFFGVNGDALKIVLEREAKGEMKWVAALFPTLAYAQDANMSLAEYEDFVYDACLPDMDDPVGYWKNVQKRQDKAIAWLKGKKQVHVTAPGTDLTLSIAGRPFINCCCQVNVPDGEIFTSPVENSANGYVNFTYPTMYEGFEVTNVRLEFKDGKAVKATADKNEAYLNAKLDIDAGARYLGEFAIGTNERINKFTGQILFDEKIGGSFHLALGHGYPESKTENKDSAIHWDMICDLRNNGEITVDGELFYKNGKFMIDF
ncbi:MAG: aminopeptidase [Anaerolineae bacterium]|jgi:aminopeptidase|nr:aminopeptidase [Anaerolineae bacterium]